MNHALVRQHIRERPHASLDLLSGALARPGKLAVLATNLLWRRKQLSHAPADGCEANDVVAREIQQHNSSSTGLLISFWCEQPSCSASW